MFKVDECGIRVSYQVCPTASASIVCCFSRPGCPRDVVDRREVEQTEL